MSSLFSRTFLSTLAGVSLTIAAAPAAAQTSDADIAVDLLQLLVEEGVVPADRAEVLLERARRNAELRAQQSAAATNPSAATIDVPYVPEIVRNQIRDEVKAEVMAEARTQGWVAPNTMPKWLDRVTLSGDFRLRYQGDYFDDGNYPFFPDANAINEAGGVTTAEGFPLLNSTKDRERYRYRARLGVNADITDQISVGLVLASGNDAGAVSTNETLGDYFNKDAIWVDRAYLSYRPIEGVTLIGGRMPNPFYSTDLVWDRDINPEGLAAEAKYKVGPVDLFAVAAYLPLQERELDSADRYLAAGQIGATFDYGDVFSFKGAGSYYAFTHVQSLKNPPQGSRINDYTAPPVLAKGNSLFNMRTDGTTTLAGLASDFDVLNLTAQAEYRGFDGLVVRLTGDFAKNLAYDEAEIQALQAEASVPTGDTAWLARLDFGTRSSGQRGDWMVSAGYRRLESDSVLDVFTDSDFGLGGTDVQGYVLEAEYGIATGSTINLRWLSSDAIERPPFSIDVLQVSFEAEF